MVNNKLLYLKFNKKYNLTTFSGTLAIEGVLKSLNLSSKSRVLISSISCHSILQAVLNTNLKPIIATPKNGIVFNQTEINYIVEKYDIDVFIAVHQYGYYQCLPSNKKLIIIDDISQAWNLKQNNDYLKSDYIIISMGKTKPLSNGIGGVILSDNNFIEKFDLKTKKDRYKDYSLIEYYYPNKVNYKKLFKKADKKINRQKRDGKRYIKIFSKYPFVKCIDKDLCNSVYHKFAISIPFSSLNSFEQILIKSKIQYQKEFKLKLNEIPLSKKRKIEIIEAKQDSQIILIKMNNSIIKMNRLNKELRKKYGK